MGGSPGQISMAWEAGGREGIQCLKQTMTGSLFLL
jgi:hypothetical protein